MFHRSDIHLTDLATLLWLRLLFSSSVRNLCTFTTLLVISSYIGYHISLSMHRGYWATHRSVECFISVIYESGKTKDPKRKSAQLISLNRNNTCQGITVMFSPACVTRQKRYRVNEMLDSLIQTYPDKRLRKRVRNNGVPLYIGVLLHKFHCNWGKGYSSFSGSVVSWGLVM